MYFLIVLALGVTDSSSASRWSPWEPCMQKLYNDNSKNDTTFGENSLLHIEEKLSTIMKMKGELY